MRKLIILALLLLALLGATSKQEVVIIGELYYTRNSVCEWPIGVYLNNYVTDGCGHEIWFAKTNLQPGVNVWATGYLVTSNSCTVLVPRQIDLCDRPDTW